MYHLKNLKYSASSQGFSMACDLYKGQELVCKVEDEGEGGAVFYHFKHPDDAQAFDAFVAQWGETTGARARDDIAMAPYRQEGVPLDKDFEQEMARSRWQLDAEQKFENEKNFKVRLKTGTPFRLKTDPADHWRWVNHPFSQGVKDWLLKEYGDTIACIHEPGTSLQKPAQGLAQDFSQVRENSGRLVEVSEAHYDDARGAVPPITCGDFWAMGEPYDIRDGATMYYHYKRVGDQFYGCLATTKEARELFAAVASPPRAPAADGMSPGA